MTRPRDLSLWTAAVVAAGTTLSLAVDCAGERGVARRPSDPRQEVVSVLSSARPHPSRGQQAQVWDRFVGAWDCDFAAIALQSSRMTTIMNFTARVVRSCPWRALIESGLSSTLEVYRRSQGCASALSLRRDR